jgi:hypothetical protein
MSLFEGSEIASLRISSSSFVGSYKVTDSADRLLG